MKYEYAKRNQQQFNALSGMKLEIFDSLFGHFLVVCQDYFSRHSIKGAIRKRIKSFRKDSPFSCYEDMLLFILIYIKNNPLQEHHAACYKMNQPQANTWIHLLTKLLRKTLSKVRKLPKRSNTKIHHIVQCAETLYIDGTERPVQRSMDYEVQKEHFSGKKNDTRLKTI